ncbi:MAG: cytochrome c4 [Hyphomicrobiales bacterium]|nr:cytochrome c4 [Hyphomicrobiales bacterium]
MPNFSHRLCSRLTTAATIVGAAAVCSLSSGTAQDTTRPADAKRGAVIAAQGIAAKAPACARCHAFDGASDGSGGFPRIAGQSATYLSEQLRAYGSGVRANAVMAPIARALSPQDIVDVASYYASLDTPFPPLADANPDLVKRGKQLAEMGDSPKGIPGCDDCHGAEGAGRPPMLPYLAGQYASYIALQLRMWKRGFRTDNPETMVLFAKELDDQEIAAVAAYYQQVRGTGVAAASR